MCNVYAELCVSDFRMLEAAELNGEHIASESLIKQIYVNVLLLQCAVVTSHLFCNFQFH